MLSGSFTKVLIASTLLVMLASLSLHAQERRTSPAFPIGAGEKMIVISGKSIQGAINYPGEGTFSYQLLLPVGSTLKRMVVQVADTITNTGGDVFIELIRINNLPVFPYPYPTIIRSVFSRNIESSSINEFKQLVSNPVNHSVLQGWSYWVRITPHIDSAISDGDIAISNIKIIYKP